MKIKFSIEDTPEGDADLVMDPPASDLMLEALAGRSTMAAALALVAYQHMLMQLQQLHETDPEPAELPRLH